MTYVLAVPRPRRDGYRVVRLYRPRYGTAFAGALALGYASLGGTELPDLMTPLTPDAAAAALATAYQRVTGVGANENILGLLLGQTATETGNWHSLHNYNFGNAKATDSDPYYQNFRCSEIVNGQEVFYDPPDPACRFAAHQTAADGAEHYIRVLQSRPHWWAGLQSGTPEGFIDGLTTVPAYFTANKDLYLNVLKDRMATYAAYAKAFASSPVNAVAIAAGAFTLVFGVTYLYQTIQSGKKRAA